MNLRTAGAAALVAALLLLARPTPRASASQQQRRTTTRQESVVFLVTKDATDDAQVEPVAVINNRGALAEPAAEATGDGALAAFLARHYKAGAQYRLIFGGAEAGTLTIRAATHAECSPNSASADIGPAAAKLGGNVMALATDGAHAPRAQASRRAPTDEERAAAFGVAKRFLTGKRVSASAVERGTKTLNLTATDLDGDGREELIGSYVVKVGPKVRDTLFLVAAPQGGGFRAALTRYARVNAKEMMDPALIDNVGEGGLGTELYVEQLDADGDGVGEVFTLSRTFEGTNYRAYQRRGGVWRGVYESYSYRCAY
ncbi:MAG TPA: hypothetical protein VM936_00200 [Pyrinomonadaceae bacterium]|jgi:hypothetical protein|nr:hypothetical protein [Pyrinomonadaceae bacterium]